MKNIKEMHYFKRAVQWILLTKKKVINKWEVPQYYVEKSHPPVFYT